MEPPISAKRHQTEHDSLGLLRGNSRDIPGTNYGSSFFLSENMLYTMPPADTHPDKSCQNIGKAPPSALQDYATGHYSPRPQKKATKFEQIETQLQHPNSSCSSRGVPQGVRPQRQNTSCSCGGVPQMFQVLPGLAPANC